MWWKRGSRDGLVVPGVPLEPGKMLGDADANSHPAATPRKPVKPFFIGDGFTLSNTGKELITYSEGHKSWELVGAWGVTPPELGIPRPEVWDYVVPSWLKGRYETVKDRLVEHSGHRIVFDPDGWHVAQIRGMTDETENRLKPCPVCDTSIVAPDEPEIGRGMAINMLTTHQKIRNRFDDGRFEIIRADVPLDETLALFDSDRKYTIITCLRCTVSNESIFWGLNIRGVPVYKHVLPTRPFSCPCEPGYPKVDNAPTHP